MTEDLKDGVILKEEKESTRIQVAKRERGYKNNRNNKPRRNLEKGEIERKKSEKRRTVRSEKRNIKEANQEQVNGEQIEQKQVDSKQSNRGGQKAERRPRTKRVKTENKDNTFEFKTPNLKIIPLGGLEEIGKNITVFEYDNEIVLVDCGLEFPEDNMLGVDLVIPDVTYLERNKDKIKGLVITHGHEDHIGSIPYVLKQVDMPIYATKLTVGLIKNKLEEHKLLRKTKLKVVEQGQTINFGKIKVEFIRSSHSIPDSVMLAINTPVRNSTSYRRF